MIDVLEKISKSTTTTTTSVKKKYALSSGMFLRFPGDVYFNKCHRVSRIISSNPFDLGQ